MYQKTVSRRNSLGICLPLRLSEHWNQFDKRGQDETDLLTEYDYDSILHYHSYAWAKDKSMPTITPTRPGYAVSGDLWSPTVVWTLLHFRAVIGQRRGYSKLDYEKINKLYRCYDYVKFGRENLTTWRPPVTSNLTAPTAAPLLPTMPTTKLPFCPNAHMCEDKDPKVGFSRTFNRPHVHSDPSFQNCPMLALQGWCEMMPGKMLFDCRKSCCNCDCKLSNYGISLTTFTENFL